MCSDASLCEKCSTNYTLNGGETGCECVNGFEIIGGKCMCPEMTTFAIDKCIRCNIEHCKTCQTADICFECLPSFTLNSNTCECPHSSYIIVNNVCTCPSGKSPSDPSSNCTGCLPTHCNACDAQN